jgi:Spy/CpxP family protein refolding chaperone
MKGKLILLGALLIMAPLALYAQNFCGMGPGPGKGDRFGCGGWDCPDGGFHPRMLLGVADKIGLTEDQKKQISKLAEEHAMARIDREATLEKAQVKLRHLMMNNGSEKEILAAIDEVGALKTEMRKAGFQNRQKIKAILNADQIKKLNELCPRMGDTDDDAKGPGRGAGIGYGCGQGGMRGDGQGQLGCNMSCRRR